MIEHKYTNKLIQEKSPYLLQHSHNPVNWYPWGKEAFEKAKQDDKPIFLSIGYSTCHWCHVMAHESFEDVEVAHILNENFISIKVDKEERPDIDSIYMRVCQTYTGSGGWPMSIFMTSNQKPFFAGTYFPKNSSRNMIGFIDLLLNISDRWQSNKTELINAGDKIAEILSHEFYDEAEFSKDLLSSAVLSFKKTFDVKYGGFGNAPKFPIPHNLLLLMKYYENEKDKEALDMVEKTLLQMYKGGIFDHIGFGFSRYSTDEKYLVPHFEKMLYDNALLIMSYITAFNITKNQLYKNVAVKTANFILRELTSPEGGFYSAQDADSDGVEGKYYVFDSDEIIKLFDSEVGERINRYFDITKHGNFEGKSIPNLIKNTEMDDSCEKYLADIYEYRKKRNELHLDDKILTSWNSLMIAAFAVMYRILGDKVYLEAAKKACNFIDENLSDNDTLYVSYRAGKKSSNGFLDDYAFYIFALVNMYEATLEQNYLERAIKLNSKAICEFYDTKHGAFYLYGMNNEQLILKPKETYDGAIPSGNSFMAYNMIKLARITKDTNLEQIAQKQLRFMASYAEEYPAGYSFYMIALSMYLYPSKEVVCVLKDKKDDLEKIKEKLSGNINFNTSIIIIEDTLEYPLINDKTTFYVCENYSCLPPTNNFEVLRNS